MPRSLREILAHADDVAAQFEEFEPTPDQGRPVEPLLRARAAVQARAKAETNLAAAVADMRAGNYSWNLIGAELGTSGEAARQRYGATAPARASSPKSKPSILHRVADAAKTAFVPPTPARATPARARPRKALPATAKVNDLPTPRRTAAQPPAAKPVPKRHAGGAKTTTPHAAKSFESGPTPRARGKSPA